MGLLLAVTLAACTFGPSEFAPAELAVGDGTVWAVKEGGTTRPPELVSMDADSGEVSGTRALDLGGQGLTAGAALFGDILWIMDASDPVLLRFDTGTGQRDTIPANFTGAEPAAIADGQVWVDWGLFADESTMWVDSGMDGDHKATELDPDSGAVIRSLDLPAGTRIRAVSADALWLTDGSESLLRLDPAPGPEVTTARFEEPVEHVAVGAGDVWVVTQEEETGAQGTALELDPATLAVERRVPVGSQPWDAMIVDGYLWVSNSMDGTVSKIDVETGDSETIEVSGPPIALAAGPAGVWVSVPGGAERVDNR